MSKGYIKIVVSLLISSIYMSNKAFATEANSGIEALRRFARPSNISTVPNDNSEEKSEKAPFNLSMNTEETKTVDKIMDDAEMLLQYHATSTNGYKLYHKHGDDSIEYFKKDGNTVIYKLNHKINRPDKYNDIIEMLWNPNVKYSDDNMLKEKIVCHYSPNIMMVQQRFIYDSLSFHGYYYAFAKKVQVSDDITIIVYTSSNTDDYNSVDKTEYVNPIVDSAHLVKPKIYSEKDIRDGELTKMFVNLSGYIIQKKKDCVDITYLDSVSNLHILIT
ncbi:fam-a protein [Plasmodium yoelii yoelii]|uniref:Fam-a protein n=1 Tax=Plasmodium yoelii yoelii TaxID=73239 RepID=A0AAE9WP84_PLAYO|nr:fam-a protein [Plasmodium yoelii yoelii]